MGLRLTFPVHVIEFDPEARERWRAGERADCPDPYCQGLSGTQGFGEYWVGQYFARQGYEWIHHDYNFLGGNRPGKWPRSEAIIRAYAGDEKLTKARQTWPTFLPLEEPDLLIFKPDFSEVRFAECKRLDTHDKIREAQLRGMAFLALLFNCPVEIFELVEAGRSHTPEPIVYEIG